MPQYFIDTPITINQTVYLAGDDSRHLVRVRRIKAHDHIQVRDAEGNSYQAEVIAVDPERVSARIIDRMQVDANPFHLTLAMALVKGSKFEFIIQKAVELGVAEIHPLISERTVPSIKEKIDKKLERWKKIAREAAKQCLRDTLPEISAPLPLKEYLARENRGLRVMAHLAEESENLRELIAASNANRVTVAIGPEGGFSPAEVSCAQEQGWHLITFGYTQLRAETAAIVLPSLVLYELQEEARSGRGKEGRPA